MNYEFCHCTIVQGLLQSSCLQKLSKEDEISCEISGLFSLTAQAGMASLLLTTKLYSPQPGVNLVPRPHLIQTLSTDGSMSQACIMLCADEASSYPSVSTWVEKTCCESSRGL